MKAVFIDDEIFLSFLVREDDERFSRSRALFERAEAGREKLETNELVLNEVVRVLEKQHDMSREAIAQVLQAVLETRNLRVPGRKLLKSAIERYVTGDTSFAEAYNVAYAEERGLRLEGVLKETLA